MEKLYYPISGGEVPSIIDRPGRTIEQIKKEENTLMSLVNLKRIKDDIRNTEHKINYIFRLFRSNEMNHIFIDDYLNNTTYHYEIFNNIFTNSNNFILI